MKSNGETPARLPRILQELVQRAIVMIIEAWLQASVGVILDGPKVNYTVVKVLYEKSPGGPCSCSELISERNFKGAEATPLPFMPLLWASFLNTLQLARHSGPSSYAMLILPLPPDLSPRRHFTKFLLISTIVALIFGFRILVYRVFPGNNLKATIALVRITPLFAQKVLIDLVHMRRLWIIRR